MAQIPHAEQGMICPLHKKDVSKVCHTCPWYTELQGTSPQGGKIHDWGCAISWLPILSVEISQKANQTAAAVESFRNVMRKDNEEYLRLADG